MALTDVQRARLTVAGEIAAEYGIALRGGHLIDRRGFAWSPDALDVEIGARLAAVSITPARGRRLLARLARMRADVGRSLLSAADLAYDEAVRVGGIRVQSRSRRTGKAKQDAIAAAVQRGEPLEAWVAAIGMDRLELVANAFDTFRDHARAQLARYADRVHVLLDRVGVAPLEFMPTAYAVEDAVEMMVAGLTALARRRLLGGPEAIMAAVPRARPPVTFDLPGMPNPEDLVRASARLVRQALAVSEGRGVVSFGATADELPVVDLVEGAKTLEQSIAERLVELFNPEATPGGPGRVSLRTVTPTAPTTLYVWRHGYYGDPPTDFEPHLALGDVDFTTEDRETDPGLANTESWPDGDFYQPGDHPGCTCEWEVIVGDRSMGAEITLEA